MFIELSVDKNVLLINLDNVTDIVDFPDGVEISCLDRDPIVVNESYDEIKHIIKDVRTCIKEEKTVPTVVPNPSDT